MRFGLVTNLSLNSPVADRTLGNTTALTEKKKARHPVGLFRIPFTRYDSCHISHPDAQTYYYCFMFWNVLFLMS